MPSFMPRSAKAYLNKTGLCCAAFLAAGACLSGAHAGAVNDSDLNTSLIQDAQARFATLMSSPAGGYSEDLQALEAKANDYARRNHLDAYSHIAIMDPLRADIGLALGIAPQAVSQTMLTQRGVLTYPYFVKVFDSFMNATLSSMGEDASYTQNPHALFQVLDGRRSACVVVPAPQTNVPPELKVRGLGARAAAVFDNTHESFHCLDEVYYNRPFPASAYAFDPADPATLIDNKDGLEAYSTMHKAEAFADTAALGELIREGADLSLIDTIADWRAEKSADVVHMSAPVLQGLKAEIQAMGLEQFRALDEGASRTFYYKVVEQYALDSAAMNVLMTYEHAAADEQTAMAAKTDALTRKALSFHTQASALSGVNGLTAALTSVLGGSGLTQDELADSVETTQALENWDPLTDLEDTAASNARAITPVTLIAAYVSLMAGYDSQSTADPGHAGLYAEKATRLKNAFVSGLAGLDYMALNGQYGLKLSSPPPSLPLPLPAAKP